MITRKFWLDPRFSPRLVAGRALLLLSVTLPIYWWLARLGYGMIALAVMIVALWPYRYRVSLGAAWLEIRWLFLRERIPLASITRARVEPDPRRWVIGPRGTVLRVAREQRREFLIFGEPGELGRMAAALRRSPWVDPPSGA